MEAEFEAVNISFMLYKNVSSMLEHAAFWGLGRDCFQAVIDKLDKSREATILRWDELDRSNVTNEDSLRRCQLPSVPPSLLCAQLLPTGTDNVLDS